MHGITVVIGTRAPAARSDIQPRGMGVFCLRIGVVQSTHCPVCMGLGACRCGRVWAGGYKGVCAYAPTSHLQTTQHRSQPPLGCLKSHARKKGCTVQLSVT